MGAMYVLLDVIDITLVYDKRRKCVICHPSKRQLVDIIPPILKS